MRFASKRVVVGTVLTALALLVTACSSGTSAGSPSSGGPSTTDASGPASSAPAAPTGSITVFAAASLNKTFTELGNQFQADNPGTTVKFSFGGSSDLVAQIQGGAPADVFASADTANMDKITKANLQSGAPVNFASNVLEIATAPGNSKGIKSLKDLANPDLKVVVCAPGVPCGTAAEQVEKNAKVTIKPVSEEQSVTDVLGKITSGEADAGLVYVTDVKGAGSKVTGVNFPEAKTVVNIYPIVALADAKNPELAKAFISYVTGSKGQAVLAGDGFGKP